MLRTGLYLLSEISQLSNNSTLFSPTANIPFCMIEASSGWLLLTAIDIVDVNGVRPTFSTNFK